MSEDNSDPKPSTEQQPAEQAPTEQRSLFGFPMEVFVKGGTTSTRHDNHVAELHADAERRRDEQDAERRLAMIPVEEGGAKMYTNQLSENPEVQKAYVLLDFVTSRGEPIYEGGRPMQCLADIVTVGATEMALIIACPSCKNRGTPLDQCQLRIRQSNKNWELSPKRYGEIIPWTEDYDRVTGKPIIKIYKNAGTVVESERFSCPCGWTARIYDNKIRPE